MLTILLGLMLTVFSATCHDKPLDSPLNIVGAPCEARWINERVDDPRCYDLQEKLGNAALAGDVDSIRAALEQGANVNGKYSQSYSALWLAASQGRNDAVKFLIAAGANVNRVEGVGHTPLGAAVSYNHPETIKILIDKGAYVCKHLNNEVVDEAIDKGVSPIADILIEARKANCPGT